jgi:hypothetical protein
MLIGQSPFHGDGEDELFDAILNERPYFPKSLAKEAAKCLSAVSFITFNQRKTPCVSSSTETPTLAWECRIARTALFERTHSSAELIGRSLKRARSNPPTSQMW